jgi:hypothetical protein
MSEEIVNRVAQSPLITIDMKEFFIGADKLEIDLKDLLFQGMILREKDLREFAKNENWERYEGKHVAIHCSEDVIIPTWAFMVIATKLQGIAATVVQGNLHKLDEILFLQQIDKLDIGPFEEKKIVIKGCGDINVPPAAFMKLCERLKPVVSSLMYGEPCSTVPVYKKPLIRSK